MSTDTRFTRTGRLRMRLRHETSAGKTGSSIGSYHLRASGKDCWQEP